MYVVVHHARLCRLATCFSTDNNITQDEMEEALKKIHVESFQIIHGRMKFWKLIMTITWTIMLFIVCNDWRQLRNISQLSAEKTALSLVNSYTTHVSLLNVFNPTSGSIVVEQLAASDLKFYVLDVSHCEDWVTPEMLQRLESSALCLRAEGCCKEM